MLHAEKSLEEPWDEAHSSHCRLYHRYNCVWYDLYVAAALSPTAN